MSPKCGRVKSQAGKEELRSVFTAPPEGWGEMEGVRRPPDARWVCSGMVYGLKAENKMAKKNPKEDQFQFLSNLTEFPHGCPDRKNRSCWFLQARCQRCCEQSAPLSPAVNPRDLLLSHRRTPAGHLIQYISPLSLGAGTSPSLHISSALAEGKRAPVLLLEEKMNKTLEISNFGYEYEQVNVLYYTQRK